MTKQEYLDKCSELAKVVTKDLLEWCLLQDRLGLLKAKYLEANRLFNKHDVVEYEGEDWVIGNDQMVDEWGEFNYIISPKDEYDSVKGGYISSEYVRECDLC
jgi:hypothetical protein